jgi:hypothetical protein
MALFAFVSCATLLSVKRSIEELRKLTNTPEDKFQQTGHFISRVIKYQVNVINCLWTKNHNNLLLNMIVFY